MLKIFRDRLAGMVLGFYDKASSCAGGVSDTFRLADFSSWLARRLSKPAALVLVELFVAVALTVNFFYLVKPEALPKPDGNSYNAFLFTYLSEYSPAPKDQVPMNFRTRLLAPMVSGWLLDTEYQRPLSPLTKEFQNVFGFYHAAWLFLLFLALILCRKDALLVMLGVFGGLMYNYITPAGMYYYPWDMPAMFFFTLACLWYDRRHFGLLMAAVLVGGLFKETNLCCALLILLDGQWALKKRITGFLATVIATLAINKMLAIHHGIQAQMFTMGNATSLSGLFATGLLFSNVKFLFSTDLNHVLFANAGSLFLILLLPWRNRRDILFKLLMVVFMAGQFLYGVINEFRIWYELLPLGWMLLSEAISRWRLPVGEVQALPKGAMVAKKGPAAGGRIAAEGARLLPGSYWLMMAGLLVVALGFLALAEMNPPKAAPGGQSNQDDLAELTAKAQSGDAESQFKLGVIYQQKHDDNGALNWFQQAAEKGHVGAQNSLGVLLVTTRQDYAGAAQWFQKAADQGDAGAELNLGIIHLNGLGVKQDATAAAALFQKSAAQGSAQAEFILGKLYEQGQGVKQDYVEAYKWLKLSQLQGYPEAEKEAGACSLLMTKEQIESAEKLVKGPPAQK